MIAVLDYGIGNLRSAEKALQRSAAPGRVQLASTPGEAEGATGVVLPGVGAFGRCMEALRRSGLDAVARQAIDHGVPFLGVCIGMQLLYEGSDEDPDVPGLGILPGRVQRLSAGVKHPQMQWNQLAVSRAECPLLEGVATGAWVYFVHSYAPELTDDVVATCDYGGPVAAMIERESLWATQFHPEKSSAVGLSMLANFVAVCGEAA